MGTDYTKLPGAAPVAAGVSNITIPVVIADDGPGIGGAPYQRLEQHAAGLTSPPD
ncbi:MAG: hypothetical protein OXF67_01610 [Cyanobacteria bacterium MAG CAR4_bin_6]|nr:hypothetical protein [Cyanobacteria bacterium MAG CAR4_bin_6]